MLKNISGELLSLNWSCFAAHTWSQTGVWTWNMEFMCHSPEIYIPATSDTTNYWLQHSTWHKTLHNLFTLLNLFKEILSLIIIQAAIVYLMLQSSFIWMLFLGDRVDLNILDIWGSRPSVWQTACSCWSTESVLLCPLNWTVSCCQSQPTVGCNHLPYSAHESHTSAQRIGKQAELS